jgi:hypothetical protein
MTLLTQVDETAEEDYLTEPQLFAISSLRKLLNSYEHAFVQKSSEKQLLQAFVSQEWETRLAGFLFIGVLLKACPLQEE